MALIVEHSILVQLDLSDNVHTIYFLFLLNKILGIELFLKILRQVRSCPNLPRALFLDLLTAVSALYNLNDKVLSYLNSSDLFERDSQDAEFCSYVIFRMFKFYHI